MAEYGEDLTRPGLPESVESVFDGTGALRGVLFSYENGDVVEMRADEEGFLLGTRGRGSFLVKPVGSGLLQIIPDTRTLHSSW